jgi:hypothetical protein
MRAVEFRPEPLGKDRAAAIARGAVIVDVYNPPSAALAKAAQGKRGAHRAREARPGRGARPSGGGAG